jgi:hypothetical protein
MNIIRILFLTIFAFLAFACATTDGEKSASESSAAVTAETATASLSEEQKATFQSALDSAKAAYAKVDETGYAWRDTDEMMKQAEEAIQAGDFDKAMKLVSKANKQSVSAYEQYEREKNAGPREE